MPTKREAHIGWWHGASLLALFAATLLLAGAASASADTSGPKSGPVTPPPTCQGAYQYFVPEAGGPCNGCTVRVGDRFVLDLMVHTNLWTTAHQAYLSFSYSQLQNARVSSIMTDCVLTSTVTPDNDIFDATLQNEICNGPGPCNFRGITVPPGSFAFASGALSNCPEGCSGDFRVARVGWCAVAPGTATLHWQFLPPTRITEVISPENYQMHPLSWCYEDYVINVKP